MDLPNLIIGFVVLLLCAAPFILMNRHSKNKKQKLIQSINQLAASSGSSITTFDVLNDAIIGIDQNKRELFFVKNLEELVVEEKIILKNYQPIQVKKKTANHKGNSFNNQFIKKIYLHLEPKSTAIKEVNLELYDEETQFQLNGELQLAEKWEKLCNANT
jgi:hypothetical protein